MSRRITRGVTIFRETFHDGKVEQGKGRREKRRKEVKGQKSKTVAMSTGRPVTSPAAQRPCPAAVTAAAVATVSGACGILAC